MDLSRLSNEDLQAIQAGDFTRVSNAGLQLLQTMQPAAPAKPGKSAAYNDGFSDKGSNTQQRSLLTAAQGPLFGFADEAFGRVVGGAKSIWNDTPYQQNYEQERDWARGAVDRYSSDQPGRAFASQMVTGLGAAKAAIGPAAKALGADRLLSPILPNAPAWLKNTAMAMGLGTVTGAINGVGGSDATTSQGMQDDATTGMMFGAAGPLGGLALVRGGGALGNVVASNFSDSAAMRYGKQKLAQAFLRDAEPGAVDPLGQAARQRRALGPEAAVADSGGESVRGLLDLMATLPGRTKDAGRTLVENRQATRADRLRAAADKGLGVGGQRLPDTLEALVERRAEAAGPLYQKLHRIDIPVNQDLAGIVSRAMSLGADRTAQKIATGRGLPWTLSDDAVNASGTYSMRDLDHLKQGIDDLMSSSAAIDKTTGGPNRLGASLEVLRKELLANLDRTTAGQYKVARDAFSGPSQIIDAANAGRRALTQDDSAITSMLRGMSPGEVEGFRIGAVEALRATLGTQGGQTNLLNMWREPTTQERLRAIFGTQAAFNKFAKKVESERTMRKLENNVGGGSQTASRQYGAGDIDLSPMQDIGAMAASGGNLWGLIPAASKAWNRVATPEPVRDAMGRMLLTQGTPASQGLLDLRDIANEIRRNRQQEAQAMGLLGGYFGQ
jgi:hypothetical protein